MKTSNEWKKRLYEAQETPQNHDSELFERRLPYLEQFVANHFPSEREARILDLGCGAGALSYVLSGRGYSNVTGVDVASSQIEAARRLNVGDFYDESICAFLDETSDDSFDVVCAFDVLEHFERPVLMDLLADVRRVLCDDGLLIAHIPNADGIFGNRIRYGDLTHELAFTRSSLNQILSALGFVGIETFEHKPVIHGLTSLLRRLVWEAGTLPFRLLLAAETGQTSSILSQNLVVSARVNKTEE